MAREIDISPMLLRTEQQGTAACVPSRAAANLIQKLGKYDSVLEHTKGYSGCENTEYRASFLQDEFVNCKFCLRSKSWGSDDPCMACCDNFIQLPSGKYVGAYFVPDAIEFQLWRIKNGQKGVE